jgi:hypothetical protein
VRALTEAVNRETADAKRVIARFGRMDTVVRAEDTALRISA